MQKRITLKDPHREVQLFSRRALALALLILVLVGVLVARLIYLQVFQHQLYVTLSQQNQLNLLPIEPNRGLIYDRNGILLAENIPAYSLEVIPSQAKPLMETIARIERIIPLREQDKQQFFKQLSQHRRFRPIPLRTRLTDQEVARFVVDQFRFPGVAIKAQLVRYYPEGEILEPVLGYVGRINENELEEVDQNNYSATNYIGKLGVEKAFEELLHGKVGYQQAETDASGRVVRIINSTPPTHGANLQLSIDTHLQRVAQAALGENQGAVVVIQPATGQVLALVSNPSFDPNLFVDGISIKDFAALREDPAQPLYNRAIRGHYPPGSTVKPIMALAGLLAGVISPEETLFDPGWFQLKNSSHIYHDWKRTGHGTVDLTRAIAESCDTYFFTLANRLGIERMGAMLRQFGFGERTGIQMQEELPGLVPSPAWKRRVQGHGWYPGDTLITGIGQGAMLATPLQLAQAVATIANRGQRVIPTLIYSQQAPGQPYTQQSPRLANQVILRPEQWDAVIKGMREVMQTGTGLAHFGRVNYDVAGKTGTAQVFSLKQNERYNGSLLPKHLRDNSLFIAFAPVDHPQIAVAVLVEHNTEAGGVARKVMDHYLLKPAKAALTHP